MRHNKRHNVQSNPNIASSTDELKANYARQAVIPPEANRDKSHRLGHAPVIGGVVLTALIAAGGVLGYNKMSNDATPTPDRDNKPNVSAPVTPGEQTDNPDATPETPTLNEEGIGIPSTDFETLNIKATPEAISEALTPVSVSEYKTPEAALKRFGQIENTYLLSATIDYDNTSDFPQTEESLATGIDILTNMLGSEEKARDYFNAGSGNLRHIIGIELLYINDHENSIIEGATGTWHGKWNVDQAATKNADGTYTAYVNRIYETNFHELDITTEDSMPTIESVMEVPTEINLRNDGTNWHVDTIYTQD